MKIKDISLLTRQNQNKKIIHINATAKGGGVVEILSSLIPLEKNAGLKSEWYSIKAPKTFFNITKKLHNSLQGSHEKLTALEKKYYLKFNKKIAKEIEKLSPDVLVIHDPQPLAVAKFLTKLPSLIIARMHIDLTWTNKQAKKLVFPLFKHFNKIIFSHEDYVPKELSTEKVFISPPAIDPLSPKNKRIPKTEAISIVNKLGIRTNKPFVLQTARFDPWKDQKGVIEAFLIAKEHIPSLQLVVAGIQEAQDDPESKRMYKQILKIAKKHKDIFLLSNINQLKGTKVDEAINALQSTATVVIQKSIREGFGLAVTEAMWKGKAVIGGYTSGIRLQIKHGINGFLAHTSKEAGKQLIQLLKNPELRVKLGTKAKQTVEKKFLLPRLLSDELKMIE